VTGCLIFFSTLLIINLNELKTKTMFRWLLIYRRRYKRKKIENSLRAAQVLAPLIGSRDHRSIADNSVKSYIIDLAVTSVPTKIYVQFNQYFRFWAMYWFFGDVFLFFLNLFRLILYLIRDSACITKSIKIDSNK